MELTTRRRRAISTVLAMLLAVESVAAVSVAAGSTLSARHAAGHALPAASPAGEVLAEAGTADRSWEPAFMPAAPAAVAAPDPADYAKPKPAVAAEPVAKPVVKTPVKRVVKTAPKPVVKPAAKHVAKPVAKPTPKAAPVRYAGSNHVWIPSLGINKSVQFFPCDRATPPGNYVYRWGCGGTNNVYLMGHASGVFGPLHDAYLNGRLVVGMKVYYADGGGTVHMYTVRWWKLARPTTDASWAWAPQSVPSMTLQTCMGANSEYRLLVRLVEAG